MPLMILLRECFYGTAPLLKGDNWVPYPVGVAGTRLLDAKQGRLCQLFFNGSTNESKKIIMCNNREFGAILEQSYFHSVSCAILYSIFSCLARAMLEWWLRYHEEGGYYLWRCRESNLHLYDSIGLNKYIIRLVSASFSNGRLF